MNLDSKTIYGNLSDAMLVERVAMDDNWACSTLMLRYKDSLKYEIQKMIFNQSDVESLVMEGFAKAFINIKQYNTKFAFSTWLFSITKNGCVDFLRHKMIKKDTISLDGTLGDPRDTSYINTLPTNAPNPEEELIKKQRAKVLYKTVAQLRPEYQEVIKLYYFKELSTAEVSKTVGIPVGRVKLYLFRARKELFAMYGVLN